MILSVKRIVAAVVLSAVIAMPSVNAQAKLAEVENVTEEEALEVQRTAEEQFPEYKPVKEDVNEAEIEEPEEYIYDYMWPLPGVDRITSSFGKRVCPYHGDEYHNAIDVAAVEGTPILACEKGVVTISEDSSGYGKHVKIDHENGVETQYSHCCELAVSVGETVEKGQVIAYVGATGNATGNHLDLRFWVNGNYVNPLDIVTP